MPALPSVGGSVGSWGSALNEFLRVGHDAGGTHTKAQMLTDMEWSPTAYAGEQTVTFPNNLKIKTGTVAGVVNTEKDVEFSDDDKFSNSTYRLFIQPVIKDPTWQPGIVSKSTDGFTFYPKVTASHDWLAIGY
jgi:hypothetical protein